MPAHALRRVEDRSIAAPVTERDRRSAGTIIFSPREIRTFMRVHQWLVKRGIHPPRRKRAHLYKTDDALVLDLVSQMAVIGNSEPGKKVRTDPEIAELLRWRQNLDVMSRAGRVKVIHRALRIAGARYAGKSVATCPYSKRLADSLQKMAEAGGPLEWVKKIASIRNEADRVELLRALPVFQGQKSPRDFLSTKLGLAKNLIALDIRIMQVLCVIAPEKIQGSSTPARKAYEAIEKALVEQIAPALGCTGYELDQYLYLGNEDGAIVKYLRGTLMARTMQFPSRRSASCP